MGYIKVIKFFNPYLYGVCTCHFSLPVCVVHKIKTAFARGRCVRTSLGMKVLQGRQALNPTIFKQLYFLHLHIFVSKLPKNLTKEIVMSIILIIAFYK